MKRLLSILVAAATCAWAQQAEPPKTVQKIIELKYADAKRVQMLLSAPGLSVQPDAGMHVIVVRGTTDAVAAVEAMVKQLDVAPQNIELTAYLVSGTSTGAVADDLPKELAATAKQLHGLFSYKSYRLLESFVLRGRDGRDGREASTSGMLPSMRTVYDFRYRSATVSSGTPRVVHLDGMSLNLRTPNGRDKDNKVTYDSVGLNTDIDVGEGQRVVVGKSNFSGGEDAMILVVTAKVVE